MILWSLWKRRNLKLWQQVDESTTQVIACANQMLEDWKLVQHLRNNDTQLGNNVSSGSHIHNDFKWQSPNPGRFKCNIDPSFSHSSNRVGHVHSGFCLRICATKTMVYAYKFRRCGRSSWSKSCTSMGSRVATGWYGLLPQFEGCRGCFQ